MNATVAQTRAARRAVGTDAAIVCSAAAALAHLVAAPSHYTWWPLAGVFFVGLGVAQAALAIALVRGRLSDRALLIGFWGTVGVVLVYVASRTTGLPGTPPVPFHGGRWVPGRSIVPNGEKYVGPLDVFTLAAELVLVVTLLGMLSNSWRRRTSNHLLWCGVVLWAGAAMTLVR